MIIATYEDALAAIGKTYNEIEFATVEVVEAKPRMNITAPIDSFAERRILDRQAHILFE